MESPDTAPLSRIGAFVVRAGRASPFHLLVELTRTVADLLRARSACVLWDGAGRVMFSTEESSTDASADSSTDSSAQAWAIKVVRLPVVQRAMMAGEVFSVADTLTDPTLIAVHSSLPPGLIALAAVPLPVGDKVIGVIVVWSDGPAAWQPDELMQALVIARVAAVLVDARGGADVAKIQRPEGPAAGGDPAPVSPATAPADPPAPGDAPEPAPGQVDRRRSVLVVDDDTDHAELLRCALTDEGYDVRTAGDGAECLRAVQENPPDLVVMDVTLPGLDGTGVAERMRAAPIACGASIIFLSGCNDLIPRMRQLGMPDTDFLPKPYSLEQLLVRMEQAFERVELQKRLRDQAHVDDLTGLGNLRLLRERLATEASRLERYGTPATVVLLDVDKLKAINDEHGHVVGSEALRCLGAVLRAETREIDLAVRYGGDEFVVLLPHTSLTEGLAFADRVLRQVRALRPGGISFTASVGVAARERKAKRSFESLLAHADVAVYRAKHAGGNCVCAYGDTAGGVDEMSPPEDPAPGKIAV